nr:hypothetical protein [Tanacetum cinerariifolium]
EVRDDIEDEDEDEAESSDKGTMEVRLDVVTMIDIPNGILMLDANLTITHSCMTPKAIKELIAQRVAKVLATYKANRVAELVVESQSQNKDDGDNENRGGNEDKNRDGNGGGNGDRDGEGNGNGNRGGSRNGNPNRNDRGVMLVTNDCTYHDFVKCQPLNFKGTQGVFGLTRTIGVDVAFAMSWRELIKLMTERFQEFTMLCTKMVLEEEDRVKKFIGGLSNNIQGNVIAAEPKRLQDAIQIANNLMDKKLKGYVAKKCGKNLHGWNYKNAVAATTTQRVPVVNQRVATCFESGRKGHYKNECPKLKNQNRENKAGNKANEAKEKAYVPRGGEGNSDSNVVTSTFLLSNRYASMLFDLGVGKSFVSNTFSVLLDVIPSTLDVSY